MPGRRPNRRTGLRGRQNEKPRYDRAKPARAAKPRNNKPVKERSRPIARAAKKTGFVVKELLGAATGIGTTSKEVSHSQGIIKTKTGTSSASSGYVVRQRPMTAEQHSMFRGVRRSTNLGRSPMGRGNTGLRGVSELQFLFGRRKKN